MRPAAAATTTTRDDVGRANADGCSNNLPAFWMSDLFLASVTGVVSGVAIITQCSRCFSRLVACIVHFAILHRN